MFSFQIIWNLNKYFFLSFCQSKLIKCFQMSFSFWFKLNEQLSASLFQQDYVLIKELVGTFDSQLMAFCGLDLYFILYNYKVLELERRKTPLSQSFRKISITGNQSLIEEHFHQQKRLNSKRLHYSNWWIFKIVEGKELKRTFLVKNTPAKLKLVHFWDMWDWRFWNNFPLFSDFLWIQKNTHILTIMCNQTYEK